ncbi:DUF3870 domain-containing protein [Clostridiaceae bacterium HSG29]|nr:DUF3870 domain-containing protein [Clostridiaceae bacterium HSG29]
MNINYSDNTVYFIAYSKLPGGVAVAKMMDLVGVGLIINYETGIIEDVSCTLLTKEAKIFLKSIIVGFNLHESDISELIDKINFRFNGLSQKAICVATKLSYERYLTWRQEKNL